jgi:hypothetical protein
MLPRLNENIEAAPLLADEDNATQSNSVPRDVWAHLLEFCTLESIGRLARVDRNLSRVVKNANLKNEFEAQVKLMVNQQVKPGYVKGSYANLKAFFAARQHDELRIEELNNSCCIDSAEICCCTGMIGSLFFCTFGSLTIGASAAYCMGGGETFSLGLYGGLTGATGFGPVSICLAASARRRDKERKNLNAQLQAVPTNLHGTMFSWQPTKKAADMEPARLTMN